MKKILMLAAIFTLVLMGCEDGSKDDGKDNGDGNTKTTLTINNQSGYNMLNVQYSVDFGNINNGGDVTKNVTVGNRYILFSLRGINGNVQCRTDETFTCEEGKQNAFTFTINTLVTLANGERKNTLKNLYDALNREESTTLTIKNTSFTDITDVVWNNVSFASNQAENAIKAGATVTMDVGPGSGHIFFKRKSSPMTARTSELITIVQNDEKEFTFTDNTVIFEINDLITNLNNSGTLRTLQSAIVWFDDAEGSSQPYTERSNVSISGVKYKNGEKSIRMGGNNGRLVFSVNLEKRGKLTFWYDVNVVNTSYHSIGIFINNETVHQWYNGTTISWSFFECNLEPGNNTIQFSSINPYNSELYLDDILIYYTE
jgi:hypothetical protein